MRRRQVLKTVGATAASLTLLPSPTVAGGHSNDGVQPVGGDLPNENVPEGSRLNTLSNGGTREVGQFLTLWNGWAGGEDTQDKTVELLNKSRHTFRYEDQTFVLESVDDWEPGSGNINYFFSHTDPPYPNGTLVNVSWDMIMTADYYDPWNDKQYHAGDRYRPDLFPASATYEIVQKDEEN